MFHHERPEEEPIHGYVNRSFAARVRNVLAISVIVPFGVIANSALKTREAIIRNMERTRNGTARVVDSVLRRKGQADRQ